jgi:hypothetical protein
MLPFAAMVAGYMGLLTLLAIASPGVGLMGAAMMIVPVDLRGWSHLPLYGGLAWLVIHSLQVRGWPTAASVIVGASFSILFGLWTELAQISAPGREPSIEDFLLDGLGVATAATMLWFRSTSSRHTGPTTSAIPCGSAALYLDRSAR